MLQLTLVGALVGSMGLANIMGLAGVNTAMAMAGASMDMAMVGARARMALPMPDRRTTLPSCVAPSSQMTLAPSNLSPPSLAGTLDAPLTST